MPAKLRINSEHTLVEIETPEGDVITQDIDRDEQTGEVDPIFIVDTDNPDAPAYAVIAGEYEGLKAHTVYQLVEVVTDCETDVEFEDDDDEEVPA